MTDKTQTKYIGGEYKVLQQFGGAMGHVYLVEKHDIPHPFVLKSYQATRPELESLFFTEVKNWVSFGVHQNIVKAIFAKKIDNKLFIAAEYVKGYDGEANRLSNFIGRDLPLHLLIKWVIQFTYGMNHCVGHGLKAHSDITQTIFSFSFSVKKYRYLAPLGVGKFFELFGHFFAVWFQQR
jgi:serine/threonine protein kinase